MNGHIRVIQKEGKDGITARRTFKQGKSSGELKAEIRQILPSSKYLSQRVVGVAISLGLVKDTRTASEKKEKMKAKSLLIETQTLLDSLPDNPTKLWSIYYALKGKAHGNSNRDDENGHNKPKVGFGVPVTEEEYGLFKLADATNKGIKKDMHDAYPIVKKSRKSKDNEFHILKGRHVLAGYYE